MYTENLRKASIALHNAKIITKFSEYKEILLENAKEGDFVYLDLPFGHMPLTEYFVEYRFDYEDQRQVADTFRKLDDRKCKVLLTTSSTPFVRELFADFTVHITEVGSKYTASPRSPKDVIIRNYSG